MKEEIVKDGGEVLCVKTYEAVSNKKSVSIKEQVKMFVTRMKIADHLNDLVGIEYFVQKINNGDRMCHFVTCRFKERITYKFVESFAITMVKSRVYKSVSCLIMSNAKVLRIGELAKKDYFEVLTINELAALLAQGSLIGQSGKKSVKKKLSVYDDIELKSSNDDNASQADIQILNHVEDDPLSALDNLYIKSNENNLIFKDIALCDFSVQTKRMIKAEINKLKIRKCINEYVKIFNDSVKRTEFVVRNFEQLVKILDEDDE